MLNHKIKINLNNYKIVNIIILLMIIKTFVNYVVLLASYNYIIHNCHIKVILINIIMLKVDLIHFY